MNKYEEMVLKFARKWYETWGKSGVDELWDAVGEMCEHENLVTFQTSGWVICDHSNAKDTDEVCPSCGAHIVISFIHKGK